MNKDLIVKIFKRTILWSLLFVALMFFLIKDYKSYILGYIFGMLISMTNFLLLKQSVEKSVRMEPSRASRYASGQYLIRFLISGLVLVIAASADYLNFFTSFLGLLIVKLVITVSNIVDKNFLKS